MEKNNMCTWCNPDENGQYSAAVFTNPNGKQTITTFFNGAQTTLTMETEGMETARMAVPINYCPMCGRNVRLEANKQK